MLQSMGSQRVSLDLVTKQQNRMSNSANKNFTRVHFLSNDVFCTVTFKLWPKSRLEAIINRELSPKLG